MYRLRVSCLFVYGYYFYAVHLYYALHPGVRSGVFCLVQLPSPSGVCDRCIHCDLRNICRASSFPYRTRRFVGFSGDARRSRSGIFRSFSGGIYVSRRPYRTRRSHPQHTLHRHRTGTRFIRRLLLFLLPHPFRHALLHAHRQCAALSAGMGDHGTCQLLSGLL